MHEPPLPRRLLAEFLGSAFLAALPIGSGIAAQSLAVRALYPQIAPADAATGVVAQTAEV